MEKYGSRPDDTQNQVACELTLLYENVSGTSVGLTNYATMRSTKLSAPRRRIERISVGVSNYSVNCDTS